MRGQIAIVRTLLDEFERVLARRGGEDDDGPVSAAEQLGDELARLSHQMREMTAALPASLRSVEVPAAEVSGTHPLDVRRTA